MLLSFFVLAVLLVLSAHVADAGLWGTKRKKKDDADEAASSGVETTRRRRGSGQEPEERQRRQSDSTVSKAGFKDRSGGPAGGASKMSAVGAELKETIMTYMKMAEDFIDSKAFDDAVTPESVDTYLEQAADMIKEHPQLQAIADSGQLKDPKFVKQSLKYALTMAEPYVDELVALFEDPVKMNTVLQELPEEYRAPALKMISGDMSGLSDIVEALMESVPGMAEDQKSMLRNLVAGNTDGLMESAKSLLGNADEVEAARQNMLENPEMADMLGIDAAILNSPERFAQYMQDSMDKLGEGGEGLDEQEVDLSGLNSKLFQNA